MKAALTTIPTSEYQRLLNGIAELSALRIEFARLEESLSREIALDRQRIAALENRKPEPRQINQAEVLRALLGANGGKMLQSEAIRKMNISKADFSKLLRTMKDDIHIKPFYKDRRKNIIEQR